MDAFSTIVTGQLLISNPVSVYLNQTDKNMVQVSTDNITQVISSVNGAALFSNTSLCGPNNSTILFNFQPEFSPVVYQSGIQATACSIILYGCNEGYEVNTDEEDNVSSTNPSIHCDTCVEKHEINTKTITIILIFVIFGLCCILLLLVTFLAVKSYR